MQCPASDVKPGHTEWHDTCNKRSHATGLMRQVIHGQQSALACFRPAFAYQGVRCLLNTQYAVQCMLSHFMWTGKGLATEVYVTALLCLLHAQLLLYKCAVLVVPGNGWLHMARRCSSSIPTVSNLQQPKSSCRKVTVYGFL